MDAKLIDQVVEVLLHCQAVPLPGGHGTYFAELHASHPQFHPAPDVEQRCYVCLALLGDAEQRESWNRKEWLPHAQVWFDQNCPALAAKFGDMPRWQYLLAAMLRVVEKSDYSKLDVVNIQDCHREARRSIMDMIRLRPHTNSLSGIAVPGLGKQNPSPVFSWVAVRNALQGSDADRTLMLYFMYTLHSQLGVPQPKLDAHYLNPRLFYKRLVLILENSSVPCCGISAAARRIAQALKTTAVLNEAGQPCIHTSGLAATLPAPFQRANYYSRPAHRALVAQRLDGDKVAQNLILAAHDLATAIADLVIDLLRANRSSPVSFRKTDYGYLYNRVRYGEREYQAMEQTQSLPVEDTSLQADLSAVGRPLSLAYAKRLMEGDILDQCSKRLDVVRLGANWSKQITGERCAICHIETSIQR